jgi:MFS family permease
METTISKKALFNASCIALIVTAMTFAIRAGILVELGNDFNLNNTQLGWINSMAFWGFPVATIFGGLLYNYFGPKKLLVFAFFAHLIGLVMTIYADGFTTLLLSSFLIGFANGSVEAACNPLIADMYTDNRTTMLNKFHVWFPGGIVIGALAANFLSSFDLGWQIKIAVMIPPTLIYGYMFYKEKFPKSENIDTDTNNNIRSLFTLLFIFIALCMTLTATTELGTQQWLQPLLEKSGASPMLILAMVTGIMAVGRYFAGPIVHKLNPIGVLFMSAIVSTVAIYLMSIVDGTALYGAAVLFAFGVCYFWPTMIGFVAEYLPKTGALGMSLVGGMGMFATGIWNPVIGSWIDDNTQIALDSGLTQDLAEIAAGKATLANMTYFPLILILFFGILFLNRNKLEKLRFKNA